MPFRSLSPAIGYHLVAFDAQGVERREVDGAFTTERLFGDLDAGTTDVFLFSHGWKGDVRGAIEQYDRWVRVMTSDPKETARMEAQGPFRPLLVGLHWPSLPFGDEDLPPPSFDAVPGGPLVPAASFDPFVDAYAARLGDTTVVRDALKRIVASALTDPAPPQLPSEVCQAYAALDAAAGLGCQAEAGPPGHDREPFDAEGAYQCGREVENEESLSFGLASADCPLFSPLRQLSFWKMKDRARIVGESGGRSLLRSLQLNAPSTCRFHVMGHSFGCIVASALVSGASGAADTKPVDTLFLAQGALSIWSYASEVPSCAGTRGYFRPIIERRKVRGATVTTQSESDTAVGRLYPLAAGMRGQVEFAGGARFPKYAALGAFGARGPGCDAVNQSMAGLGQSNGLSAGRVFNLDASRYITGGTGLSGSHSNIDRAEVAQAFWEAVRVRGED
jgi:hypothetical protein